ncbi:MAG TPA: LysM peptidoglycan-binding domain-containing protein [Vicinamibacteria bacterium]|nr:LysM peptidoglycan-binding domain-containing protein [Vicinamibacteria bacterium]
MKTPFAWAVPGALSIPAGIPSSRRAAVAVLLLLLAGGAAGAPTPETSQDIVVPPHWSPYQAPTSYPEGTRLHIIVRGDTLWDLANQYLQNPFLWPHIWDANRYIRNPHLIYPGDPLRIPEIDLVRPVGEAPEGVEPEAGPEAEGPEGVEGPSGPSFIPAYEQTTIQCASYMGVEENESFQVFGSEEGDAKDNLATGDIVYLNRGSNDGVSPGDQFYVQRREEFGFGDDGHLVRRTGWLTVLAVQESSSMAEITQGCMDVHIGDYLKPFEPIPVPLLPVQAYATRLTPETGRMRGTVAASLDSLRSLGEGHLVSIDLGQQDGVVPGNVFVIFRYVYPNAPRKVLGELAVLTVQPGHATARIMESKDFVKVGDLIELK